MDPDSFLSLVSEITLLPPTAGIVIAIAITIFLLATSAFISSSELAFFSLSPADNNEIKLEKHRSDKTILKLKENQEYFLAMVLIINNLVNVAIVVLCSYISNSLIDFGSAAIMNFIFQTIIITFLLLLFGEVMPKVYASQHALKIVRFGAVTHTFLMKLCKPLSYILVKSTGFINKRLTRRTHNNLSIDELSQALELTSEGIKEDKEILEGIVNFGSINVEEIMTSRIDMITVEYSDSFNEVIKIVTEWGYSRLPVCDSNEDDIKGILYAKDLLPYLEEKEGFTWQTLIRPAFFVPETKKIDDLLNEFQQNKMHIAIVVDEFGGTSGLITMEDILEEIVGDISDEYDDDDKLYEQIDDNTFVFDGKILLNDFFKLSTINSDDFDEFTEPDTLAGLLLELKGEFPEKNEVITYKNYSFQAMNIDKHRIKKIKLTIK